MGVAKAKEKVKQATILLYLYDKKTPALELAEELSSLCHKNLNIFLLQNKIDLDPNGHDKKFCDIISHELDPNIKFNCLGITTKESKSLIQLKKQLNKSIQFIGNKNELILNNSRHLHALNEALVSIKNVKKGIMDDLTGDLLSIDLKEAIEYIGTITGKIDIDNDILDTIFSQFCIGK